MGEDDIEMKDLLGHGTQIEDDFDVPEADAESWDDEENVMPMEHPLSCKRVSYCLVFLVAVLATTAVSYVLIDRSPWINNSENQQTSKEKVTGIDHDRGHHHKHQKYIKGSDSLKHHKHKKPDSSEESESKVQHTNTSAAQETECTDDPNFMFRDDPTKTCAWAAEHRRRLCSIPKVRKACPMACKRCSVENEQKHEIHESIESNKSDDVNPNGTATNGDAAMPIFSSIIPGVEDKDVYCEDLSMYDEWHATTVTKSDGPMYEVVEMKTHDKDSFTQGLTYARGKLFESAGLYGKSTLRILDPDTATVEKKVPIQPRLFAEGLTYYKDTLVQITWKSHQGFIYNITDLAEIKEFTFETTKHEGWGITWDRCRDELIVTDGSKNLHFWDPNTMEEKRRVSVKRMDGSDALEMNEIEFWRGRVLANVWYEDVVLVINPETGVVEKEYDFSQLWPRKERTRNHADVLNGISISDDPDILFVTGKLWDRMYRVKLLPEL